MVAAVLENLPWVTMKINLERCYGLSGHDYSWGIYGVLWFVY